MLWCFRGATGPQLFPVGFMEEAGLQPVETLTDGQGTDVAFHLILPLPGCVALGMLHNLSGGFLIYKVQVVTVTSCRVVRERPATWQELGQELSVTCTITNDYHHEVCRAQHRLVPISFGRQGVEARGVPASPLDDPCLSHSCHSCHHSS